MITALILIPLAAALCVALAPSGWEKRLGGLALAGSLAALAWSGILWIGFDAASAAPQFVEARSWIPAVGGEYILQMDGISLLLVLLTGLVVPFSLAAALRSGWQDRISLAMILVLQSLLYGCFTAGNFLLWFLFWELTLIPAYLLIKLRGGPEETTAAMRFMVMTLVGGVAMLAAFLGLYAAAGTFDFLRLAELGRSGELTAAVGATLSTNWLSPETAAALVFGGVLLGLAVKVPMWPLHIWLPDAYEKAPTAVSMLLTGILSKMGIYGFLRILVPVFPDQLERFLTPLLWLAVATIVLAALAALAQRDLKRMVAYSSISHLGYCLLGLFAAAGTVTAASGHSAALSGVLLQTFNHGITAAALFCFVGFLENRSGGVRTIDAFGGLRSAAPVFCGLMGVALFASLGLPGLNGFVGEFLIFKGVFSLAPAAASVAVLGLLGAALLAMKVMLRVFHGPLPPESKPFPDLTAGEKLTVLPAVALMVLIGIFPQPVLTVFNAAVVQLAGYFGS